MGVEPLQAVRSMSMARVGFGAAGLLMPRIFLRSFAGREVATAQGALVERLFASRELVLGLLTLHALEDPSRARRVVQLNAAADATDALSVLLAGRSVSPARRLFTFLGAVGATAASVALARQLAE